MERPRLSEAASAPTPAAEIHPDGLPRPQRDWAAATVWLALAMTVLDGAIANVALPSIAHDLSAPPADSIWIVNAYQLAIVISLLPLASLGEIVGYRRIYQGGLAVFTVASLLCALSHTLPMLTLARTLQGFGAAGVMSVNGALVRFTYPTRLLGRGVGLNALVISIAAAVGPTVAAAILAVAHWQWLFLVNVPVGVATFLIAARSLPVSPRVEHRFDWLSAILNAVTFGLLVSGVDVVTRTSAKLNGALVIVAGLVCGTALVRRELARPRPMVPIDLLTNRIFALSVIASICAFSAQMATFVVLPFHFQGVMHRTEVQTGLLLTPWPVAVGVAAPLAGWLADKWSAAILGGAGMVVLAIGLALFAALPPGASDLAIVWRMAVCGFGFGFFQSPNNRVMLSTAPRERAGAAGGMLATARLTGQTTGAVLTAIFLQMLGLHAGPAALGIGAALALAAGLASQLRGFGLKAAARPAAPAS
jgi:DHA2 family multidrug resistance protein-like MFS transporter